jgi:hypothetical protein
MLRHNNWMQHSFDDGPINGSKPNKDSVFKLHFAKNIQAKDMSYYRALFHNASMIAEDFPQPFDVLFSGGIDSEIMIRVNHALGIRQNVHIVRLENDYNVRDVATAKNICQDIGIKLNIIDWNLEKWIENEAEGYYKQTFSPYVERLVRFAWFKMFDNVILMGEGEPYWRREICPNYMLEENWGKLPDYSIKSKWHLHWVEDYFASSLYSDFIKQPVIGEWYNYTPEIANAYHKLPIIKKLINDELTHKVSSWSSRTRIHQRIFPTIKDKIKLVGYEGSEGIPFSVPEFLKKFQNEIMKDTRNTCYKFSSEDIDNLLT